MESDIIKISHLTKNFGEVKAVNELNLVNEKEAETFDRAFPYMEKKKLPGQIF